MISSSSDDAIGSHDQALLTNIVNGRIGEYFTELCIKLGSLHYVGSTHRIAGQMHNFARLLYNIGSKSRNEASTNYWRWQNVDTAIELTNKVVAALSSAATQTEPDTGVSKLVSSAAAAQKRKEAEQEEELDRRRLQLSGCSAPWYWLGDGYCDASANNADCNWDNGDCCSQTCDSGAHWEDNDGNSYSGYSCGVNGYNCIPGCSVSNPSWLGDGYCDKTGGYNTAACGYDLGDCCQDTCHSATYSCGYNGYQCYDQSANWCSRSKCGNDCLGLCGADCDCWTFTCGDCHCHGECAEHDTYCSCDSYLAFWCVNVFWVNCDNGDSAVF